MGRSINLNVSDVRTISIDEVDDIDVDSLLNAESICFYNQEDRNSYINTKSMDNVSYANKCFKVVKELRDKGYEGHIIVDCDSLFDLGNSLFNYNCYDARFTTSLYRMEAINDLINCYNYNNKDVFADEISKKELFTRILFFQVKELFTYIEEKNNVSEEIRNSIHDYICLDLVYDIGKILGANFIKYSDQDSDILYYFDNNSREVFKYYPIEMLDKVMQYLDQYRGFLDYDGEDELLMQDIGRAYDEIIYNDDLGEIDLTTIYDDLLNCNCVEDFKNLFRDGDLDIYYKLLSNILMDLSFDDYSSFIKNNCSGNLKLDINTVIELILRKKNELTRKRIVMSVCQAQK